MAEVHISSGLLSSFVRPFQKGTRELERLIDALPGEADAKHHIWNTWPSVADEIIAKHKAGRLNGPIVLIGHSNGGIFCCNIAHRLAEYGIEIPYIGLIDPTAAKFEMVSGNVWQVDEFWASSGFPAIARWMSNDKRGACQFVDEWSGEHNLWPLKSSHVDLATHDYVIDRIYNQVSALLGKASH